jgi:hypothetical protein
MLIKIEQVLEQAIAEIARRDGDNAENVARRLMIIGLSAESVNDRGLGSVQLALRATEKSVGKAASTLARATESAISAYNKKAAGK